MRLSRIHTNLGRRQLVSQLLLDLIAKRVYTCIFVYAQDSSKWFNTALYFNGKQNWAVVIIRFWLSDNKESEPRKNSAPTFAIWRGSCLNLLDKIDERKDSLGHIALRAVVEEEYKGTPLTLRAALSGFPDIEDFIDQAVLKEKPKRRGKNAYDPNKDANQPMLPWPIKE